MSVLTESEPALAYDSLAPYYDQFTLGYAHEAWIEAIEHRALALGLEGTRALDIACGTGKSTTPLVARGYDVLSCDVSPEMIREARRKCPSRADSFMVADMRRLPPLGGFDLVLCVDDALNYLLSEEELTDTFAGVAGALAPNGIFVFDVNSLATYREAFGQAVVREQDGLLFAWRGEAEDDLGPRETAAARVEIFSQREDGLWERRTSHHVQRHHPPEVIRVALAEAGLECAAVMGQLPGARLEPEVDEARHSKLVYFARLRPARRCERT
jgi:SAM-dependent methyltransferase